MVGLLHLKESKAFLDNSPVLRVSEAVLEVDPEHGSGSLEVRRGLLRLAFPPFEGGALEVGARKQSLMRGVSVLPLVTEINTSALGLKRFKLFRFMLESVPWF